MRCRLKISHRPAGINIVQYISQTPMPELGKKGRAYNPIFWASESTDKATILVNHFNLRLVI